MRNKFLLISITLLILTSCVGTGSKGVFGTGVSIALDPRSLGTQIDDSIMQKNLVTRLTLLDKNYFLNSALCYCWLQWQVARMNKQRMCKKVPFKRVAIVFRWKLIESLR